CSAPGTTRSTAWRIRWSSASRRPRCTT
ncbi:MAG: hypothetical protein AVDCRST_MAG93-10070, partial [uncultured Chloroflexia bacterium]